MGIIIDSRLRASITDISLPSGPIDLVQVLHSDLGGEPARITYSLDQGNDVVFQIPGGTSKQIQVNADIPGAATQRTDTVTLGQGAGGISVDQVTINQSIEAENVVEDGVTLNVEN
jgi:hypothetical protein